MKMTISDVLIIVAVLAGPIFAVQVQKWLEFKRERKSRKMQVFRTSMSTRGIIPSSSLMEAFNMIDIEFYDEEKVKESWKLLLDCLNSFPQDINAADFKTKLDSCNEKTKDLTTDLIYEMAQSLGFHYDKVHLKRAVYIPKVQVETLYDSEFLRKSLVEVFLGKKPLPIKIVEEQTKEGKNSA
jgi:hypothetical protein